MNENNKSFYPLDMFEFIHHPEYGCRDIKGLKSTHTQNLEYPNISSMGHAPCIVELHVGSC
jgi:hypothetical protein